jgi:clan AA aspartic protease
MGIFSTTFRLERFPEMKRGIAVEHAMVDTGAEFTWVPKQTLRELGIAPLKREDFTTADGRIITRDVGFAVVRYKDRFTVDEIIFALPGDLTLLGAHTLEGLGLMIDARRKRLVAAGPAPAAAAVRPAIAKAMGIIVGAPRRTRRAKPARKSGAVKLQRKRRR